KTFSQIRNEYDNNSLNLFTETNYLSSVFLQFIALIIKSRIENIMNAKKLNRIMTFKEMVSEISNIMTVSTPGVKKTSDTYMNDSQIRILEAFGIDYTEK
ncbi:MAG: hypothetical protein J5494_08045, partial [Candidatus Methanomethylophilaceae archaeon]|nr:hypothetical protein [Candidatus Methanomethylophilaceae archaeon]